MAMLANREFELKLPLAEMDFERFIHHPRLAELHLDRKASAMRLPLIPAAV